MNKIILKKIEQKAPKKRSSVVIKPETYMQIYQLAHECGMTIENLVDTLLKEALKIVEIEEADN